MCDTCVLCANTYSRASCSLLTLGTRVTTLASCSTFAIHPWSARESWETGVTTGTLRSVGTLQDKGVVGMGVGQREVW